MGGNIAGAHVRNVGWIGGVWIIITGQIGAGLLSLPHAWAETGWILSPVFFVIFCLTSVSGCTLIAKCMDLARQCAPRARLDSIEHASAVAGGKWCRRIIAGIFYFDLWFLSVLLVVAMATTTSAVIEIYKDKKVADDWYRPLVAIMTVIIWPLCLPRDMSYLSFGAGVGVFFCFLVVCAMFWGFIHDVSDDQFRVPEGQIYPQDWEKAPLVGNSFGDVMRGWNVFAFCFAAAEIVPSLYLSLKNPAHIHRIIWTSHLVTVFFYCIICVFAIWVYGYEPAMKDTISYVIRSKGARIMIAACIACHLAVTIPVWIHPVGVGFEDALQRSRWFQNVKPVVTRVFVRSLIVLSLGGVAMVSPQVTPLQGVSGAFTTTIICIILPAVLYIFLKLKLARINAKKNTQCKVTQVGKNTQIIDGEQSQSAPSILVGDEVACEEPDHVLGGNSCSESEHGIEASCSSSSVEQLPPDAIVEDAGPLASHPSGKISARAWLLAAGLCLVGSVTIVIGCIYSMSDLVDSWKNQSF